MNVNQLSQLRDAEPFEPFAIVLEDKSEVAVTSREGVYIPPVRTAYFWVAGEEGGPMCVFFKAVTGVRMLRRPRRKRAG